MPPRRLSWLLLVPLTAAAGVLAHVVVQSLAVRPHGSGHVSLNHVDVAHWPLCAGVCGAIGFVGLLFGRTCARVPLWTFALVPPAGFVVQEEVFALSSGLAAPPIGVQLFIGLVLQIPFAVLTFLVARAAIGYALGVLDSLRRAAPTLLQALPPVLEPLAASWPGPTAFVLGHGQRAPPARL